MLQQVAVTGATTTSEKLYQELGLESLQSKRPLRKQFFTLKPFFPSSIAEWNKISREVRISENIRIFKKRLLEFTRPSPNSIFDIHDPHGIKLLVRLRLRLGHLNEHKLKHGFNGTINYICICGGDIELINHFLLHCPEYCEGRQILFDNIHSID